MLPSLPALFCGATPAPPAPIVIVYACAETVKDVLFTVPPPPPPAPLLFEPTPYDPVPPDPPPPTTKYSIVDPPPAEFPNEDTVNVPLDVKA